MTYRYYTGTPLWPFGFGLSYAAFEFSSAPNATLHTTVASAPTHPLCFVVTVSNAGMPSDVVVLAFIHSDHPDATPNPKLANFVRESSLSGRRDVQLCVGVALPLVDDDGRSRILPGEYRVTVGAEGGVGGSGAGSKIGTIVVQP